MAMLKPAAMHSLKSGAHTTVRFVMAILFLRVLQAVKIDKSEDSPRE
jgi:hypothetical protein